MHIYTHIVNIGAGEGALAYNLNTRPGSETTNIACIHCSLLSAESNELMAVSMGKCHERKHPLHLAPDYDIKS